MKILIAEDDMVSAKVLQIALESNGHSVVTTDCAKAGRAVSRASRKGRMRFMAAS